MKKNNYFPKTIAILTISFLLSLTLINYYDQQISPQLLAYTEVKIKQIAVSIIGEAINSEIEQIDTNNLFEIIKDNDGEIEILNFHTLEVNEVLSKVASNVEKQLKELETGQLSNIDPLLTNPKYNNNTNLVYSVPLGVASNNIFLSNLGPEVPVKLNLIGDITTNIDTSIKEYGINNALLELYLHIEVTIQITIPFNSTKTKIINELPLTIEVIQGKIPLNYTETGYQTSSYELEYPLQNSK